MFETEIKNRVKFIQDTLAESNAKGIVVGLSGGKDSALVAILCKMACDNVFGVIMPCGTKANYGIDRDDAISLAKKFNIEYTTVDLLETKNCLLKSIADVDISKSAEKNIAPRLRMTTLYAVAATKNYLVAGTGNRSENFVGYFTKWGDGAHDFNPINDLTVSEIYQLLKILDCPQSIIDKAPSGGLFDGQTDEGEMGITYSELDEYILNKKFGNEKIDIMHKMSAHKRNPIKKFKEVDDEY